MPSWGEGQQLHQSWPWLLFLPHSLAHNGSLPGPPALLLAMYIHTHTYTMKWQENQFWILSLREQRSHLKPPSSQHYHCLISLLGEPWHTHACTHTLNTTTASYHSWENLGTHMHAHTLSTLPLPHITPGRTLAHTCMHTHSQHYHCLISLLGEPWHTHACTHTHHTHTQCTLTCPASIGWSSSPWKLIFHPASWPALSIRADVSLSNTPFS